MFGLHFWGLSVRFACDRAAWKRFSVRAIAGIGPASMQPEGELGGVSSRLKARFERGDVLPPSKALQTQPHAASESTWFGRMLDDGSLGMETSGFGRLMSRFQFRWRNIELSVQLDYSARSCQYTFSLLGQPAGQPQGRSRHRRSCACCVCSTLQLQSPGRTD